MSEPSIRHPGIGIAKAVEIYLCIISKLLEGLFADHLS